MLLSTYELGHQPLSIAVPAAAFEAAGHSTRGVDLSVSDLTPDLLAWAEAVVISIPMHTATRLGREAVAAIRQSRPGVPVAWHGLYAPVLAGSDLVGPGDLLVAGEAIPVLLSWLDAHTARDGPDGRPGPGTSNGAAGRVARPGPGTSNGAAGRVAGTAPTAEPGAGSVRIELGPARATDLPLRPLRRDLPPLERYARLQFGGREITAASVATTTGCNHRCRHCPVASIYRGRSRVVDAGAVLDDIEQVVAGGARHVSFADPDFLNRPGHALGIARRLHARHPDVTFDATVKVEHILRHRSLWPELSESGLLFVVSAFESVDDHILTVLDKGHTAADESLALGIVRGAGVELRPSWLPFTPWTTLGSIGALLEFVAEQDLVHSTDPVQYSIRLLLPNGSLLLDVPDETLARSLRGVVDGERGVGFDVCGGRRAARIARRTSRARRRRAAGGHLRRHVGLGPRRRRADRSEPPQPAVAAWLPGMQRPRS